MANTTEINVTIFEQPSGNDRIELDIPGIARAYREDSER